MRILVTGAAGFIGSFVVENLIKDSQNIVVGLDSINEYYDKSLKYARLKNAGIESSEYNKPLQSQKHPNYTFIMLNLEDKDNLHKIFETYKFDKVCNLAAQAGVRYSISNPYSYIDSNIIGFINILESCRHHSIKHLIYASSSSIYGLNKSMPFKVSDKTDQPISLYAATKKSNELMAYTYSHLFNFQSTGLRFFTVYGPYGRPDMALFLFTKAILDNKPINVFNNGEMMRDFTYIDDCVDAIMRVINTPYEYSYKIYNIGNNKPVKLIDFITILESSLNKKAVKNMLPMQAGDVKATYADISDIQQDLGYTPKTSIKVGVQAFVKWYKEFYNIK